MRLRTVRPVVTAIGVIGAAAVYPAAVVPKHEHALLQIMVKTTVAVQVKVKVVTLNPVRPVVTAIGVIGAAAATPVAVVPKHEHALLQIMVKTTVAVQVKVNLVQIIQDARHVNTHLVHTGLAAQVVVQVLKRLPTP